MLALLVSLLAAAPVHARFVLEVQGLPVAELRVSVEGRRYVYESTHFLEEGPRERRLELKLDARVPEWEVLALLTRPAHGCRAVLEERTQRKEQLCVEASDGERVRGTLDAAPFEARYDDAGRLEAITLPGAAWRRTSEPTRPPAESPFKRGVPVPEGELVVVPPLEGARWLPRAPRGIGSPERVGRARCLVEARAEAARRPGAQVTIGVVVEGGRAYPHAWLTHEGAALDPSVLPDDPVLAQRRYLEVPAERSAAFFLQLFDGTTRLVAR